MIIKLRPDKPSFRAVDEMIVKRLLNWRIEISVKLKQLFNSAEDKLKVSIEPAKSVFTGVPRPLGT